MAAEATNADNIVAMLFVRLEGVNLCVSWVIMHLYIEYGKMVNKFA